MLYNGRSFSYADIRLDGFPGEAALFTSGIRSIECSDEAMLVEPKGPGAIALPSGEAFDYSVTASIEVVTDVWESVLPSLPESFSSQSFNLILTVGKSGATPLKREFIETQIKSVRENWQKSGDGLTTALTLKVRYLLRNGKCLVRRI